jgi:hypothetical protein
VAAKISPMHRRATTVFLGERDQVPCTSGRMRNQKVDKISDFSLLATE